MNSFPTSWASLIRSSNLFESSISNIFTQGNRGKMLMPSFHIKKAKNVRANHSYSLRFIGQTNPVQFLLALNIREDNSIKLLKRNLSNKVVTKHESSSAIEYKIGQSQRELKSLHAEGRYYEALELAKSVQSQIEGHFGKKHPVNASAINNVAIMQKMLGLYDDAIGSYTLAVQVYEDIVGKKHASYGTALCNLGLAYKSMADTSKGLERMGLLERAQEALEDVLDLRKKILESTHPDLAMVMSHLGTVLFQMGKHESAEAHLREALESLEEKSGPETLLAALAQNNLAVFLKATERYEEALPLYQRSRGTRIAKLGVKHPDTIVSTNNLAELYRALGDDEKAEVLQQQIVDNLST